MVGLFIVECSKSMTEQRAFLRDLLINYFWKGVIRFEEPFKYFVWIISESVASLELSFGKKSFSQLFPAVLIIKSPLDRVTENFVGLRNLGKVMIWGLLVLFGKFGMPPENFLFVVLRYLFVVRIPLNAKNFVVIFHHFESVIYATSFIYKNLWFWYIIKKAWYEMKEKAW